MDIKEIDVETVHEPLEHPVPKRETTPSETPVKVPEKEPVKV